MTTYTPEYLERWKIPQYYIGEHWPEYFVFLSQNRDSDALVRSNFKCGLAAIGGEQTADDADETPLVRVVRESHWLCGWVDWIAIHESATQALMEADRIAKELEDYPVVDECDYSQEETDEANETWRNCYNERERIAYIREHRSQFEFHDYREMRACVRGEYFCGYASELIN